MATPIFFRPKSNASRVSSALGSSMAGVARQHDGVIDTQLRQGGLVALFRIEIEKNVVAGVHVQPGILSQFVFQLACTPPGITQGDEHVLRPLANRNILQDIARGGKCNIAQLDAGTVAMRRHVQDEAPIRLHWPPKEDGCLLTRTDFQRQGQIEPFQKVTDGEVGGSVDPQPQRSLLGMSTYIGVGVGQSANGLVGHGHKELPGHVACICRLPSGYHDWTSAWLRDDIACTMQCKYQTSIISKSCLRAPHSGHTQLGGTSSQRVPGAIPSSGRPASSSYIHPQIRHIHVRILSLAKEGSRAGNSRLPIEWG